VATDTRQQQLAVQLLAAMGQLQGLLSDLWSAMALLGPGCLQSEPAVAAAAAAAAAAGQGLLQGLAAVAQGVVGVQQQQEEEEDGSVGRDLQEQLQSECLSVGVSFIHGFAGRLWRRVRVEGRGGKGSAGDARGGRGNMAKGVPNDPAAAHRCCTAACVYRLSGWGFCMACGCMRWKL
jgi:hypothetical protein